ncbi:MAG: hypothetical protein KDC34_12630 [Saprospiraceae bacterium]|nr:hypothetical protein [Saprospiraceae bacterium]
MNHLSKLLTAGTNRITKVGRTFLHKSRQLAFPLAFLAAMLFSNQVRNECGPGAGIYGFQGYSFLNDQVLRKTPSIGAFYLDFESMAMLAQGNRKDQVIDNVTEWVIKVCENALPEDVANLIYNTPVDILRQLRTAIQSKSIPPPVVLSGNTFMSFLYRNKCEETIDYLIFAKECEPHVKAGTDPWKEQARNVPAMEELIESGTRLFKKTESDYIKLRYAYQLVRLAHYAGKYQEALDLYDYLMPKLDLPQIEGKPSLIYYWLLGHKAGALLKTGKKIEASYLYALIFQNCPSRRQSAFRSFAIKTDEEWSQLVLLCRNKSEEATMYALRAHNAGSKAMEEMQRIYELDPTHPFLEILLLREIKELERDLLGLEFNDKKSYNQRNYGIPRPYAGTYVISMQAFVHQLWSEGKVSNPPLWQLAEGYLELLSADYYAAAKNFREVEPKLKSQELKDQLAVFRVALEISAFETPSKEVEERAYRIWKDEKLFRKYPDFSDFLGDKLVQLYEDNHRPGKAFLARYTLNDLRMNPKDDVLDDLQKVPPESERTPIERLLFRDDEGADIRSDLYDMEAVLLFQNFQLEAALQVYKKIPRTKWDNYGPFDPFRGSFTDCISCAHSKDTADLFNRGELLEELLDLEYKARAEPVNSAVYYYKIGIALYNMTYFGHSWQAMDYFRSGSTWSRIGGDQNVFSYPGAPYGNKETMNVAQALYYFEKSRLMAADPELQARASFMAAKCELINYYQSKDYRRAAQGYAPVVPAAYRTHFQLLVDYYEDTAFFEELVEECSYFRLFVGQ